MKSFAVNKNRQKLTNFRSLKTLFICAALFCDDLPKTKHKYKSNYTTYFTPHHFIKIEDTRPNACLKK